MGKRWPNVSSRSERSQSGGMGKQRRSVSSGSGSQPGQRKRKRRRKRHIVPPLNSLKSGRGREFFSVDSSVVPLPGDNVPPSIQMPEMLPTSFSGSQPGHPKQKRKRKRHIVPPLNSLKSGRGKEFFSVDSSLVTLQGDNAEPSMQMCEKFPSKNGSEPGKAENGVRNKKRTFPLRSLKHRNNTIVSFNCSGVPFQGDGIDTSLQFSKSVPSEREMIHSNPKHSRRARRKDLSRVYIREDDHAAPVQVVQQYFTSLDQNRKTSFLSTSGPNKEHFSVSFESAESNVVPSHEKVDSALANRKSTKRRHSKSSKKRGKDSCDIQHMTYSSLQPQSNIGSNHSSAIRVPERGKDSENTKGSDILGDTACLSDSITHVGKDATGDLALNNIGFFDKEKDYPPVLIERALRCPFRKKLLVLDLNGILCDVVFGSRGSCMPYKKVNSRSVFKRPFLDDFLAFCFERFVVGVWSSRNKKNIVGVIDYIMGDSKNKLLFCWDQSKCTVTGFNTIEKRHKPLVLKELIKLWNKEEASLPWVKGEYSPSNTLLVDDSPYKALCNPPHTAIFPFPYDFRDEDDSVLGPGGAVRVYLESISRADDVQEHVKEHSFGQHAITSENKMWSFYKNIIDKINSVALTRL